MGLRSESADTPSARVLGGRWELLSPLARGGMGVLYVGQHLQTGRRAAVKVIEQASPEALARFRLEASVCAQINHPGIVDVFDADLDSESGSCFIAMELLEGGTLREVMDDPKSTPNQVMELLINALEPLAAAHAKGFVHRDLKPENLFVLAAPRGNVRIKLLDFGIVARKQDQRLTRAGMAMGTPHYMSPEQATSARDAGPASDVWSIGVMLYEAIKGDVPFAGETSHGVIIQACTIPHMPLDHVVPGVDPSIARLIDRCLAKQPAERPENAQALIEELRAALKPNSLPVARPSLRSRASQPLSITTQAEPANTHVRPSLRTRSVDNATHMLMASGVVCSLSALALPFAGLAAPGTALLCAAVGGGLLFGASSRLKTLRELLQTPKNDNAVKPVAATVVLAQAQRPKPVEYPLRGRPEAAVRIELYADLTCAITRRSCQRVMSLRVEHPDDISVVYKPFWDPQRELAPLAAEIGRALFEREGADVFWAFFDRMLNNTRRVTADVLLEHAAYVCPDMHGLRRALRTHVHRRGLSQCRDEAESLGVDQSPTIRINGTALPGEPTEDRLRWAFVDAMSGVEQRRKVELGETRMEEIPLDKDTAVRGLLVRYRGARNAPVGLSRTRDEARERASKLRSRAGMAGNDFGDVALRFADALLEPEKLAPKLNDPQLGETVMRMRIGEMSEPIECDEGFQVLQRIS